MKSRAREREHTPPARAVPGGHGQRTAGLGPDAERSGAGSRLVPARFHEVHAYLESMTAARRIAGATVLVAEQGETVYLDAVGMRDAEAGSPMTVDTIFRICSMTKPVTSVGVLMLMEEGRVGLDDPLSGYIPAFEAATVGVRGEDGRCLRVPCARPITIRHLLTQMSGLPYPFLVEDHLQALYRDSGVSSGLVETSDTMAQNLARLARLPLVHQPGEGWTYGLSMDVLGHVIELVSGQTLAAFLEERIFAPLGMTSTGFRVASEDEERLAAMYWPRADYTIERLPEGPVQRGDVVFSAGYPLDRESAFYSGGAGLVSTVSDYVRFAQALLQGGALDGVRLLKPETVAMMTRDQVGSARGAPQLEGCGYGLGVAVVTGDAASHDDMTHGSPGTFWWDSIYHTLFWADPQRQLVGVAMTQIFPWAHLGMWPKLRGLVYAALDR